MLDFVLQSCLMTTLLFTAIFLILIVLWLIFAFSSYFIPKLNKSCNRLEFFLKRDFYMTVLVLLGIDCILVAIKYFV